ncbi:MAG TPA: DUF4364 family protein [Clostridiales bacterium]|nr:DUF4364 family protein [Clostridiales bacterium]
MRHDDSTSNKILLLFVLEKLEIPVTEEVLLQLCSVDNQWIPYFLCRQAIQDLLQSGFIAKIKPTENLAVLSLTQDGIMCISHFYKDIPNSKQKEIAAYINDNRAAYKRQQEFRADYKKTQDGFYMVTLKISQISKVLLEINIEIPEESLAKSIVDGWPQNAPLIYRNLYENLVE